MELDDLKLLICSWSFLLLNVFLLEVYIVVWEKVLVVINLLIFFFKFKEISRIEVKINYSV